MDEEGTLALLDSLEDRWSRGKSEMKTFDTMLVDKENYQPWRDQMLEFLDSQRMKGFIDGTLRDPDPKGESEVEHVRLYSEKWKKLDKQVMEWTRDSLDDTLREVVKESKASKDIWDMLRTYFDIDTDEIATAREHVRIKLHNQENYDEWKLKMEEFLEAKGMLLGHVNGQEEHPDPREESEDENLRRSEKWKRQDKVVMIWIMALLHDILKYMVEEMKTSKEIWDTLEMFFTTDNKALSAPLVDRHSQGEGVVNTFGIGMINKENCQAWRNQMMEFLYLLRMKGFIDGTFRDPDPKGEIEEENETTTYSKKWKSFDKQVMACIIYSLNDTLYYMVEEMKTAKELWDTLEMFFTRALHASLEVNYGGLYQRNYQAWRNQMMEFLYLQRMKGFIDGTFRDPDPKGEIEEENETMTYSKKWKSFDKQVMECIIYSLTDTLKDMVEEMKTAKELWDTLEMFFTTDTGVSPENYLPGNNMISIILRDKESYQPWRDQMMEFLYSKRMKGFIDGTFRDPDPKGESGEETVWSYSKKWKSLDKKVMEWIRDSLNDIFNYMVLEMKTSREMWNTVVTFFTGDTGAQLASLEDSHCLESIKIRLLDKESCQPWRDEMMKFLNSKRMKGFIDGTSRDPDPKGESGKEHVRIFSAIWKKADKHVMNWIMASLNDILNYMVENMKTAKDMWDTLGMFFSEGDIGPFDSNSLPQLENESTYIRWKERTESNLVNEKVKGFIDGTFRDPSKISRSIRQRDMAIVKVYSERWALLDECVMKPIKSSLSLTLHDTVKDLKSSKEVWHALEILSTTGYPVNILVIEASFLSIKLSGKENYFQWAQQIKGLLELHGLQNLIDPLSRSPPITFETHKGWKVYNQLLKGWIFNSLTQSVIDTTLPRIPTATGLWGEIKNRYGPSDVEYTDLKGGYNHGNYTELYKAIMSCNLEATKYQLDKEGYDVELSEDGPTPLHVIIVTRKENYEYFEEVLDHVVRSIKTEAGDQSTSTSNNPILVNLVNRAGRNILHRAALVGNLKAAKRLVDTDPYLLFKEDNDKCLPIEVAISTPHKDTFRYLLIASKKYLHILGKKEITETYGFINPFKGKHGVRLLNAAIEAGYMEVAYQLIKMDPESNIASEIDDGSNGIRTPLHKTVENYDKYYSLPIRWRIFDQDLGMEFKAAKPDETTIPLIQGETLDADICGRWYSKAIHNSVKGFKMIVFWNQIVYTFKVLQYVSPWICASVCGFLLHLTGCASAIAVPDINSLPEHEVTHNKTLLVLRSICNQIRRQSTNYEKRGQYHSAACVAACEDLHEALKEIAEHFPEAMLMEDDGSNLMQLAIKYRSEKVFNFLAYETKVDTYFFKVKPKFGTSLLHYAGGLTPTEKLDKDSGAALQMRKEVKWFKKVEKFALPGCDNEKNNMGETPMMVFRKEHADLKKRGEEWMKTVANSYIVVAALIITITFAALITVPGGSQQDSGDQNNVGLPVYIKNNHFRVFVFSDMISFCGATIALVMFLSILTSRYTEEDFNSKLPWKLTFGLFALIFSLMGMLVAFGETLHLMLGHKDISLLIVMGACIGLPIVIFIWLQLRMIWKIFR